MYHFSLFSISRAYVQPSEEDSVSKFQTGDINSCVIASSASGTIFLPNFFSKNWSQSSCPLAGDRCYPFLVKTDQSSPGQQLSPAGLTSVFLTEPIPCLLLFYNHFHKHPLLTLTPFETVILSPWLHPSILLSPGTVLLGWKMLRDCKKNI